MGAPKDEGKEGKEGKEDSGVPDVVVPVAIPVSPIPVAASAPPAPAAAAAAAAVAAAAAAAVPTAAPKDIAVSIEALATAAEQLEGEAKAPALNDAQQAKAYALRHYIDPQDVEVGESGVPKWNDGGGGGGGGAGSSSSPHNAPPPRIVVQQFAALRGASTPEAVTGELTRLAQQVRKGYTMVGIPRLLEIARAKQMELGAGWPAGDFGALMKAVNEHEAGVHEEEG